MPRFHLQNARSKLVSKDSAIARNASTFAALEAKTAPAP
jgi:hypothetical protein